MKGPVRYFPPLMAVAAASPSLALQPHLCPTPSSLQKRSACPSHLQLSPYFFTSNWVLLLESRLSENRAEIFHVPGLRTDKGEIQPTCPRSPLTTVDPAP